jgi:hypothetical protein
MRLKMFDFMDDAYHGLIRRRDNMNNTGVENIFGIRFNNWRFYYGLTLRQR